MVKSNKSNNVSAKMYDTLVRPVITEKSMLSSEAGKVTFLVPLSATKDEVKAAVEAIFNVKVNKVNTIRQVRQGKTFQRLRRTAFRFQKSRCYACRRSKY